MTLIFVGIFGALVIASLLVSIQSGVFGSYLAQSYDVGLKFWARWLPISSMILFVLIIFASITPQLANYFPLLSTRGLLRKHELFLLAILAPFFLTQLGSIIAIAISVYISFKIIHFSPHGLRSMFGISVMLGCSGFVSFLGDKIYRYPTKASILIGVRIRSLAKILLSVAAIFYAIWSLLNLSDLLAWYRTILFPNITLSSTIMFVTLVSVIIGWLFVILTTRNHFIYAVLCLPTITIFAFFSAEHYPFTVLPAVICLSLLVGSADYKAVSGFAHN